MRLLSPGLLLEPGPPAPAPAPAPGQAAGKGRWMEEGRARASRDRLVSLSAVLMMCVSCRRNCTLHHGAKHTCGPRPGRSRKDHGNMERCVHRSASLSYGCTCSGAQALKNNGCHFSSSKSHPERLLWLTLPGNIQGNEFQGTCFHLAKSPH